MWSYWEHKHLLPKADVFILGEGIVGFSAAISLKERYPNIRICIIDGSPIGQGASTKNAGFACFGSMTEILDDLSHANEEVVWEIVKKRWDGLQLLRKRLSDDAIRFESTGGYELFEKGDNQIFQICADNIPVFNRVMKFLIGQDNIYSINDENLNSFGLNNFSHLISNKLEGQLDTGLLYRAFLYKCETLGITNFRGFRVEEIDWKDESNIILKNDLGWSIDVPRLIIATNGFTKKLFPELDIIGARNQVLVTKPIPNLKIKGSFHFDRGYYYFRDIDGRILLGGGRNIDFQGESTTEFGTTQIITKALEEFLVNKILMNDRVEVEYWWSGILGIGNEKKPIIRKLNKNLVLAVRMGGMGVAIGSMVGNEAAQLLID
ncbi:MAG: hypothetical protein RJA52_1047 [Bacteroidota bacterium]|jgi:glycine/D-amino acid oxidase-like deaminating enzyme